MNTPQELSEILKLITFDERGLVPVIAQHYTTGEVLMMAWMSKDSIELTLNTSEVHYWSRSRSSIWKKGETSGNFQHLKEFYIDCDGDTLLVKVDQVGPACHTGEKSCFFKKIKQY